MWRVGTVRFYEVQNVQKLALVWRAPSPRSCSHSSHLRFPRHFSKQTASTTRTMGPDAQRPSAARVRVNKRGSRSNSDPTAMWVRPLPRASRAAAGHTSGHCAVQTAREPRMLTYPPRASLDYVPLARELSEGIRKGETPEDPRTPEDLLDQRDGSPARARARAKSIS